MFNEYDIFGNKERYDETPPVIPKEKSCYGALHDHTGEKVAQKNLQNGATIVTANPGWLLQMKLGIEQGKLSHKMRGIYIVDLLLEAIEYNS